MDVLAFEIGRIRRRRKLHGLIILLLLIVPALLGFSLIAPPPLATSRLPPPTNLRFIQPSSCTPGMAVTCASMTDLIDQRITAWHNEHGQH